MIKFFILVSTVILWSTASFASIPADDHTTIVKWTQHLNTYYPDLRLRTADNTKDTHRVLNQLNELEDYMQSSPEQQKAVDQATPGKLDTLSCLKCICIGCAGGEVQ